MNNLDVKEMRKEILRYVAEKGGQADRTQLRNHLKIPYCAYWPVFDQAVKTKKLIPVYGHGEITVGIFLRRPAVIGYLLAVKQVLLRKEKDSLCT